MKNAESYFLRVGVGFLIARTSKILTIALRIVIKKAIYKSINRMKDKDTTVDRINALLCASKSFQDNTDLLTVYARLLSCSN